ncbi:MAG: InlB B-repeat-containing protein [Treponema sp.]|jgi:hypothetical protein|nr:InlB B-repeat-containing protein [Treponema sp.]
MRKRAYFFKRMGLTSLVCGLALAGALISGCDTSGGKDDETTYTVIFNRGTGASGTAPVSQEVSKGASITLPGQETMTAPSGKSFAGWKTSESTYAAGASVTINANTTFTAQWTLYGNFYNYPAGRVDANNGRLTITNSTASEVLLFISTAEASNYIGSVGSLSNVKVRLPEEKFYTIVAVDKENYEEQTAQASQFNVLTYYSNTQPYTITVSPSSTYGGGTWIFNNNSGYWVQIKKTDLTENYAVIAPNAIRVSIPIALNTPYDYFVYFSKELKYGGKVVALVETTDRSQANTAIVTNAAEPFTTIIQNVNAESTTIKPAVLVKNNSNKSIRIYYANSQKTNGAIGADFVIGGGKSELISGFETEDSTTSINFSANAWENNKFVPIEMFMQANKVYEITIPANENAAEITVTEVDASRYYN